MKKKYLILPDWVRSMHDGQEHFISADELVRLYGVNKAECQVCRSTLHSRISPPGLIVLRPRYDGDYSIPEQ